LCLPASRLGSTIADVLKNVVDIEERARVNALSKMMDLRSPGKDNGARLVEVSLQPSAELRALTNSTVPMSVSIYPFRKLALYTLDDWKLKSMLLQLHLIIRNTWLFSKLKSALQLHICAKLQRSSARSTLLNYKFKSLKSLQTWVDYQSSSFNSSRWGQKARNLARQCKFQRVTRNTRNRACRTESRGIHSPTSL